MILKGYLKKFCFNFRANLQCICFFEKYNHFFRMSKLIAKQLQLQSYSFGFTLNVVNCEQN